MYIGTSTKIDLVRKRIHTMLLQFIVCVPPVVVVMVVVFVTDEPDAKYIKN